MNTKTDIFIVPEHQFSRLINDLFLGDGKYEGKFRITYDSDKKVLTIHNIDVKTEFRLVNSEIREKEKQQAFELLHLHDYLCRLSPEQWANILMNDTEDIVEEHIWNTVETVEKASSQSLVDKIKTILNERGV